MNVNNLEVHQTIKKYPDGYYMKIVWIEMDRVKLYDPHKARAYWVSKKTLENKWASFQ